MSFILEDQAQLVKIRGSGASVVGRPGATILESLLENGIDYPHGCTTGFCGLCKSQLLSGRVHHLDYNESALSTEELKLGLILPCCAIPELECEIEPAEADMPLPPLVSLGAEIAKIESVAANVWGLQIRLEQPFDFLAGQYATLSIGGAPPREFSMASLPGS